MDDLLDRVPPHSDEAEMAVIGACMLDNAACVLVAPLLSRHDFYSKANGTIWAVIRRLHEMGNQPDLLLVRDWLDRLKKLDVAGGPAYLREITDAVPTSANAEHYARIVKHDAMLRKLVAASVKTLEEVYDAALQPDEVLFNAVTRVSDVAERPRDRVVELKTVLHQIADDYEHKRFVPGIPCGLEELDVLLCGGFRRGEVTIIAGRPGMGKSSLVSAIARNLAMDGLKTLFVTLEMSERSLAVRWLAGELNVPTQAVRSGTGVPEEKLVAAASTLANMDMSLSGADRVLDIKAALMGAEVVVIDFLQLMETPRNKDSMSDRIGEITNQIKRLARTENIIVLLLSQLNRNVEQRSDKRPMLADLRSSGNIEQDADNVLFLYRPREYDQSLTRDEKGFEEVVLSVAKQRDGPTGVVKTLRANLQTHVWKTSSDVPF